MSPPSSHPEPARDCAATLSVARARIAIRRRRASSAAKRPSSDALDLLAVVVGAARPASKFLCPLCASTFGRRCELKRHVAEVHSLAGARRFACTHPACPKSFTRKDALAKHQVVKHQGKRSFVCPTCSEKFTSRYDLTRHNVRVHSNVKKRFTCEFCAAGFSQKSQLTMHKGRVHSHAKTPPQSRARTPDPCQQQRPPTSMDSLAAVAVAMAQQEEKKVSRTHIISNESSPDISLSSNFGPPSRKREADHSSAKNKTTPKEEAEAAAFAADTLLEAAAVLQPRDADSSFTTNLTDATRMESVTCAEQDDSDADQVKPDPQTSSSIVEN